MRQNALMSLQRSPNCLAGFREGNREGKIERAREGMGMEGEGKEGKGK